MCLSVSDCPGFSAAITHSSHMAFRPAMQERSWSGGARDLASTALLQPIVTKEVENIRLLIHGVTDTHLT